MIQKSSKDSNVGFQNKFPINLDTLSGTYKNEQQFFFQFGYMKMGTFDKRNFSSSRTVLVNVLYKYVPFNVFKFSFLLNVV